MMDKSCTSAPGRVDCDTAPGGATIFDEFTLARAAAALGRRRQDPQRYLRLRQEHAALAIGPQIRPTGPARVLREWDFWLPQVGDELDRWADDGGRVP